MGIKFDDQSVDVSGVSDRRGMGGRRWPGGRRRRPRRRRPDHLSCWSRSWVAAASTPPSWSRRTAACRSRAAATSDLETRCNTEGAIEQYDDCYLVKVYNEINEVWDAEFGRAGETYQQPGLVFFTQAVSTGCGQASSQVGPFYCPPDQEHLHRPRLPRPAAAAVRRRGPLRAGVHPGPRGRPPPADALRHRAQGARGAAGEPRAAERALGRDGAAGRLLRRACGASWPTTPGNVSIGEAEVAAGPGRGGGRRRRPDPAADPGPGRPGVLDARLGRAAQAVVHDRAHAPATSTRATRSRGCSRSGLRWHRDQIVAGS